MAGRPAASRIEARLAAAVVVLCLAGQAVLGAGEPPKESQVPRWDARGLGPLPWQGIACVDMTADGLHVAVGTIAPPGDWNVFGLDASGRIVAQHRAGERWIDSVAVGDGRSFLAALCTTPLGHAGDRPAVGFFADGKEAKRIAEELSKSPPDLAVFDYGDHSNHLARPFGACGDRLFVACSDRMFCFSPGAQPYRQVISYRNPGASTVTAFAAGPSGRAVVGLAVTQHDRRTDSHNLVVLDASQPAPLWKRPVCEDAASPPPLEKGVYGPPAPPYQDSPAWAPLSVAMDPSGKLVASADYQGWNRRFDEGRLDHGIRFVPTRPTIHVYGESGQLVRRFGPEGFDSPFWADLAFSSDGKRLLVSPHNWTSRGLAGQPLLPADGAARSLYEVEISTGQVRSLAFPDAISSVAAGPDGRAVVGCWDHRVYLLDAGVRIIPSLPQGLDVGAPSLVRVSRDGSRILAAATSGVVRMLDAKGKELWRNDLNQSVQAADKPWTRGQRLGKHGPGVWAKGGARFHSDLGGVYVVEAPEGLLLIDANAGLSIDSLWAQIEGSGLDPRRVRYVLLTHEHGDHAPGAYLWRVLAGAQVVAGAEAAYSLQHHIPRCSGYGFHPPQPVDIPVASDQEMVLAGLKVKVLRLPGHTYGSCGYFFEKAGRTYAAIGDVIMPGGALGYAGSLDFSAENILASLRKLAALKPDAILGGHGSGDPDLFIARGIAAGEATGWSRMKPEKPDPLHGFAQRNTLVAAWLERIVAAAFGDVDGDGLPDVVVLTREPKAVQVKVFLNRKGAFSPVPSFVQDVPEALADASSKVRLLHVSGGKVADIYIAGERQAALLLSQGGKLAFRTVELPIGRAMQAVADDFNGDGKMDLLLGQRFVGDFSFALQKEDGTFHVAPAKAAVRRYFDIQLVDVNGDGRRDLVTSGGDVFLRQADGSLPLVPSMLLAVRDDAWTFMAAADFNGDGRPDLAFLSGVQDKPLDVAVFYNSGDPQEPFTEKPTATFGLEGATVLRDGPTVADWNGDGIPDLILASSEGAAILLGSPKGLSPERVARVTLDYKPHYDTKLGVADFNGDGKADLAGWGPSAVGAVGVYVWLQP